jgi:hypothetical protein
MLDKMNILVGYLKDGLVVRKLIYFIKKSWKNNANITINSIPDKLK